MKKVNLKKGYVLVYDFGDVKVHNYTTNDLVDDQVIVLQENKKLVLLELGVGFNTPSIIRFPFESITSKYEHVTLLRVNDKYPEIAFEIQNKSILVKEDCGKFIQNLLSL